MSLVVPSIVAPKLRGYLVETGKKSLISRRYILELFPRFLFIFEIVYDSFTFIFVIISTVIKNDA